MTPFFTHLPDLKLPNVGVSSSLIGKVAVGAAAADRRSCNNRVFQAECLNIW